MNGATPLTQVSHRYLKDTGRKLPFSHSKLMRLAYSAEIPATKLGREWAVEDADWPTFCEKVHALSASVAA